MRIAILSDIHSNQYALKAVFKQISDQRIDKIFILGDIFGYYPWAVETYQLIARHKVTAIKGNHDLLIHQDHPPKPVPAYWKAVKNNQQELFARCPQALKWLNSLECRKEIWIGRMKLNLCHGTPDDPANGKFYPDNNQTFNWFPKKGEILLLGHTHYPLFKCFAEGGMMINPGSVGQPRDGIPYPSWCILDMKNLTVAFQKTRYNYKKAAEELEHLNWDKHAIMAIQKSNEGALKI